MLTDVTVIGGGPAGAATAITLARGGLSVVLVEKAHMPRDKFCGDGLTASALKLLDELGLESSDVSTWHQVSQLSIRSPGGREVLYPFPQNRLALAAVAERRHLDSALLKLAKASGASVHEGSAAGEINLRDDRVDVRVETLGTISSRFVVAADGMWSTTRRLLGLSPPAYRGDWHAFRQYFEGVNSELDKTMSVWFEEEILPGYVWAFPLPGGRANVGFGVWRAAHPVGGMSRHWSDLLKQPHIAARLGDDAEPVDRHRAWPIPTRLGGLALWAPRVLFCGDAAAVADPMTGEGIGQALLSGLLAAKALLLRGPNDLLGVRDAYLEEIKRHLHRDFKLARRIGRILRTPAGADLAVALSGLTPFTRKQFARWLFEDYPRALMITPDRWRASLLPTKSTWLESRYSVARKSLNLGREENPQIQQHVCELRARNQLPHRHFAQFSVDESKRLP